MKKIFSYKTIKILLVVIFLLSVGYLGKNYWGVRNSSADSSGFTSWTETLKKAILDFRSDPSKIQDENLRATVELDSAYQGKSDELLKWVMDTNKGRLENSKEKTQQLAQGENGSPEKTYYIEPNQFRKICDQNTYVLYSRIGGSSNRDLRNPKDSGGAPTGEESFWKVPTCSELAQCHCCINTCMNALLKKVKVGKFFIWVPICLPNVGFGSIGCSTMCKAPIARSACSAYSAPTHEAAYNRDCMGRVNGCEGGGGGCKIIIKDPNNSQFEFIEGGDWKKSKQGDNVVPEGTTVKKLNQISVLPPGWIDQLDPAPGKCCKCIQSP